MNKEEKKREAYYADPLALPPECDLLCMFRVCLNKYEDKGAFSQGRGYNSYNTTFRPACATRLNSGCPSWRGGVDDKVSLVEALQWAESKLRPGGKLAPIRQRRVAVRVINEVIRHMKARA